MYNHLPLYMALLQLYGIHVATNIQLLFCILWPVLSVLCMWLIALWPYYRSMAGSFPLWPYHRSMAFSFPLWPYHRSMASRCPSFMACSVDNQQTVCKGDTLQSKRLLTFHSTTILYTFELCGTGKALYTHLKTKCTVLSHFCVSVQNRLC